jgi:transposase
MGFKLSESEIRKRLRVYENLKKCHKEMGERQMILKKKVSELTKDNHAKNKQIEKQKLRIEELEIMKFGKKRRKIPKQQKNRVKKSAKTTRTWESYRRSQPSEESVTATLHLELNTCPICGEILTEKKEHIHYREDLKQAKEIIASAKRIIRTTIESGKCHNCNDRKFALEVPKQKVIIGENVRQMVTYLSVVQGQSYAETQRQLKTLHNFEMSSGQIANILEGESRLLKNYYDHLVESLEIESKKSGAHYDETSWKTQSRGEEVSQGNYCWVKTGVVSEIQIFWFGESRGKGVAERLRGEKKGSIGVSDDYGSYKYLFDHHQLCWAHPHRKLRDLAESGKLKGKALKVCQQTYKRFQKVYKQSRKVRQKWLQEMTNETSKTNEKKPELDEEQQNLKTEFKKLFVPTDHDPEKLKKIRSSLEARQDRYFTFFKHPQLPLDNNKAERSLRKIVLKRKKSFGSQSQKSANVLSILYSVIFSMTALNPDKNFFDLYPDAANFEG